MGPVVVCLLNKDAYHQPFKSLLISGIGEVSRRCLLGMLEIHQVVRNRGYVVPRRQRKKNSHLLCWYDAIGISSVRGAGNLPFRGRPEVSGRYLWLRIRHGQRWRSTQPSLHVVFTSEVLVSCPPTSKGKNSPLAI